MATGNREYMKSVYGDVYELTHNPEFPPPTYQDFLDFKKIIYDDDGWKLKRNKKGIAILFRDAENEIAAADVLIVGGSSLTVYPAASLVGNFEGKHLIIINYSPTDYDRSAEFVIRESVGEVLSALAEGI